MENKAKLTIKDKDNNLLVKFGTFVEKPESDDGEYSNKDLAKILRDLATIIEEI